MQPWDEVAELLEEARRHLVVCVGTAPRRESEHEHWERARRACTQAETLARTARRGAEGDASGLRAGIIRLARFVETLDDARKGTSDYNADDLAVITQGVPILLARCIIDCQTVCDM
jgi:hypothetical protein